MVNPTIISAIVIIIALWSVIPACCWLGSSKKIWMPAFAGMTAMLSIICFINPSFATTSHNLYDAKGNMIASCNENGCEYFIYQAVSRVGIVKDHQFTHQDNGIDGKAGEIVRNHNGVQSSQLWVTDFHGSVVTKLTAEEPEIILFDAFGGVLNEEDCKDYHYTDKPRIGCTKLHNFNARFYDPKIGRFITTDPIEQHHLNWFAYANNNPLSFIDPTGSNAELTLAADTDNESSEETKNPSKTSKVNATHPDLVVYQQRGIQAKVKEEQGFGSYQARDYVPQFIMEGDYPPVSYWVSTTIGSVSAIIVGNVLQKAGQALMLGLWIRGASHLVAINIGNTVYQTGRGMRSAGRIGGPAILAFGAGWSIGTAITEDPVAKENTQRNLYRLFNDGKQPPWIEKEQRMK